MAGIFIHNSRGCDLATGSEDEIFGLYEMEVFQVIQTGFSKLAAVNAVIRGEILHLNDSNVPGLA